MANPASGYRQLASADEILQYGRCLNRADVCAWTGATLGVLTTLAVSFFSCDTLHYMLRCDEGHPTCIESEIAKSMTCLKITVIAGASLITAGLAAFAGWRMHAGRKFARMTTYTEET